MFREMVPLWPYTSYRIGGPARWFVQPRTEEDVQEAMEFSRRQDLDVYVMGRGTNLLVSDSGVDGLVIHMARHFARLQPGAGELWASSGLALNDLILSLAQRRQGGFELLAGIPGSLGGAVTMNAGAFRVFIGDFVREVRLLTLEGNIKSLQPRDLEFGYRYSVLQEIPGIILAVRLRVEPRDQSTLEQNIARAREHRQKHPRTPSCGSVFRNPPGLPAGQLVEQLGLKGKRVGQAQIALEHGNFIVNLGGAKARDVYALIQLVQTAAAAQGIELRPEVRFWGKFESPTPHQG